MYVSRGESVLGAGKSTCSDGVIAGKAEHERISIYYLSWKVSHFSCTKVEYVILGRNICLTGQEVLEVGMATLGESGVVGSGNYKRGTI